MLPAFHKLSLTILAAWLVIGMEQNATGDQFVRARYFPSLDGCARALEAMTIPAVNSDRRVTIPPFCTERQPTWWMQ